MERTPTALGKPIAELEGIQRRIGQAELLLHQARTQLYYSAELWDRYPERRVELSPLITAAKVLAVRQVADDLVVERVALDWHPAGFPYWFARSFPKLGVWRPKENSIAGPVRSRLMSHPASTGLK